ncbi:uncharacterized protein [Ranitomeya imitator]|uniref:uncharacterized protein n=1 Tax=Ranitomeya imitator TaxID=111125 RepID=UPI0037E90602
MPHLRLTPQRNQLLLLTALLLLHHHSEQEQSRRRRNRRRPKRMWVHPIIQEREEKGHFHVLYRDLRSYPDKFTQFCWLSIEAFDRLLIILGPHLSYEDTVMQRAISAEEKLLITLRSAAMLPGYSGLHSHFLRWTRLVPPVCLPLFQPTPVLPVPASTQTPGIFWSVQQHPLTLLDYLFRWDSCHEYGVVTLPSEPPGPWYSGSTFTFNKYECELLHLCLRFHSLQYVHCLHKAVKGNQRVATPMPWIPGYSHQ